MAFINLREYYPFHQFDMIAEVSDDLAAELQQWERDEQNYYWKRRWHHAYYSLDYGDDIERCALFMADSPDEHYEKKLIHEQLYAALRALPQKQMRRVYAHFILGLTETKIAQLEGVGKAAVCLSISHGMKNLERMLKISFM